MSKVIPELVVSNMNRAMEFYTSIGFVKDNEGIIDDNGSQWNSLAKGDANVWLLRQDVVESFSAGEARGNGVHLYLGVDNVDELYEQIKAAGGMMNIVKEIQTAWYGLREFSVADPDGYIWTINQPVDARAEDAGDGQDE